MSRSQSNDDARPRGRKSQQPQSSNHDIPFRDADTDIGEMPVDELDTFVIPGTDERGASEHVHMRITPYLRRQIKVILNSNRFPYLSESSFIRHAIVRHIYWLVELRHSIPKHITPALAGVLEICRDDEMRIQVELVFQKIDERVAFHMSRGDHGEVIRLLNLVKAKISGVQPSTWQRTFWDQFNRKWSGYLTPSQTNTH